MGTVGHLQYLLKSQARVGRVHARNQPAACRAGPASIRAAATSARKTQNLRGASSTAAGLAVSTQRAATSWCRVGQSCASRMVVASAASTLKDVTSLRLDHRGVAQRMVVVSAASILMGAAKQRAVRLGGASHTVADGAPRAWPPMRLLLWPAATWRRLRVAPPQPPRQPQASMSMAPWQQRMRPSPQRRPHLRPLARDQTRDQALSSPARMH